MVKVFFAKETFFSTFIIVFILLLLRNIMPVLFPILHCEDGRDLLAYHFNSDSVLSVFQYYNGYLSLYPNFVSEVSILLFPLTVYPYVSVFFAILPAAIAYSMFSSVLYRGYIASDRHRKIICICLALVPLGNHAMFTNLMYSLWNILLVYIFILLMPNPFSRGRSFSIAIVLTAVLAIWTHPLAILGLPILLYRCVFTNSGRIYYLVMVAATIAYFFLGKTASVQIHEVNYFDAILLFLTRVIFEPFFGNSIRMWAVNEMSLIVVASSLLLFLLAFMYRQDRRTFELVSISAVFIVGIFVVSILSRGQYVLDFLNFKSGHRYFYISQYLVLFVFFNLSVPFLMKHRQNFNRNMLKAIFSVWIVLLLVQNASYFSTGKSKSDALFEFLHRYDGKSDLVLDRGVWSIKLNSSK
ncbi:Uncharacterised protein [BD1-7 clade bacterium]|uniref:Membrane protein 6-pyruvoyl-tetrahydropterin synthase-related domain-containing protein n=1 Tax=BD1-7 clade bacterium TaxID=2029982 RepID=A0A5S9PM48_9GAMM|nr:Uncharacterised protein [BD1-7 clade bacterium]